LPEDHELVILGDGSGRRRIERLVADRGLKGRVRCLGHVPEPELRRWLSTAAVVVSMSRLESYGLTLYEGLAAGASVVASDIPAHRELTDSQPPGIVHLLPVEASADQIAAAILDASGTQTNPPPRLRSWDDTVEKLLRIYARVTGRHDSQRRHRLL
jgi:glycosyltransferase involved in cell wall biosynthesis